MKNLNMAGAELAANCDKPPGFLPTDRMRSHMVKRLWVVVPLVTVLAMLGCTQAVTPAPDTADPDPTPAKPTLIGTWQFMSPSRDDDGMVVGSETRTLTFTPERFIEFNVARETDGTITDRWRETGTWTATEDTVSKTYYRWDDQNERRFDETTTTDKNYVWGDEAREVLFVHPWGSDDDESHYDRGTRVNDPIPYPLTGTWTGFRYWDVAQRDWTFTFGDSFTESFDNGARMFTLTGQWRLDEENLFFFVTVESASDVIDGVANEDFDPSKFVGHELRYAYAPSGLANTILLSPFGVEREYDDATSMWVEYDGPRQANRYWMLLERTP